MADKKLSLHERLVKIQQELKTPKGQYNDFGKYKYRSCEDILEAVKPLLGDCKLTIADEIIQLGDRYYIKAQVRLSNDNGGEIFTTAFAREEEVKKGMDASQITGSASSYARKYALNGLFAIDDTKDADTQDNTQSTVKPQPKFVPDNLTATCPIHKVKMVQREGQYGAYWSHKTPDGKLCYGRIKNR